MSMDSTAPTPPSKPVVTRSYGDSGEIGACLFCAGAYVLRRPKQKFCSDAHRAAYHKGKRESGPPGVRGVIKGWRKLHGSKVSITIHVDAVEAASAGKLGMGQLVGLVE